MCTNDETPPPADSSKITGLLEDWESALSQPASPPGADERLPPPLAPRGLGLTHSNQIPNTSTASTLWEAGLGPSIAPETTNFSKRFTPRMKDASYTDRSDLSAELQERYDEIKSTIERLNFDDIKDGDSTPDVARTLSKIPERFRHKAFCKILEGVSRFGKVPVKISEDEQGNYVSSVAGEARPMGCPEAAGDGNVFILAWREGDWWNWDLPRSKEELNEPAFTENRGAFEESGKYLGVIQKQAQSGNADEMRVAKQLLKMIPESPTPADRSFTNAQQQAFLAGVRFAQKILYKSAEELYAERSSKGKKSDWPDILRHALSRHGFTIKAKDLIGKLSLEIKHNSKIQERSQELTANWPHLPQEKIDVGTFSQKLSDTKLSLRKQK